MSDKEDDRDELMYDSHGESHDSETEELDPNVFKIRSSRLLDTPHAQSFTTEELHTQIHEGIIDLNPPYQRDVVWPHSKQMGIINSIFHNFYVPPVIFATVNDDDGEKVRVCVDGKQRLTSILNFFDGHIPYKDPDTKKLWYYTVPRHLVGSRLQIPQAGRMQFASKQITCIQYDNLSAVAERDVFQRVQLGMSLSSAEKLQAISSPRADWICHVEIQWIGNASGLTHQFDFDTKRGRNFQNVAFIAFCCASLPDQQMPTVQKLERWLMSDEKPDEELMQDIDDVFQKMRDIGASTHLNAVFRDVKAKVAPVEFIFIGIMLYVMRGASYTDQQRARALLTLRQSLRSQYKDIRLNARVGHSCWEMITRVEAGELGLPSNVPTGPPKGKRRKRADDQNDEPAPSSSAAKGKGRATAPKAKRTRTE